MPTLIKRLTIDITLDEHRRLKTMASFHGVTMKDFLLGNLLSNQKKSRKGAKTETAYLLGSAANKKRLLEALKRNSTDRTSFGSVKELKHALGI